MTNWGFLKRKTLSRRLSPESLTYWCTCCPWALDPASPLKRGTCLVASQTEMVKLADGDLRLSNAHVTLVTDCHVLWKWVIGPSSCSGPKPCHCTNGLYIDIPVLWPAPYLKFQTLRGAYKRPPLNVEGEVYRGIGCIISSRACPNPHWHSVSCQPTPPPQTTPPPTPLPQACGTWL